MHQRTIIGIGEAMLAEQQGRVEPAGLSLDVARQAVRMRHTGIAISRLGQDISANELLTKLTAEGVDVGHLQSDPDLPTAKLVVRSVAGRTTRTMHARAAFDNLQWDFDLVDVAQQADAVVFGMLAQRGGQSRAVIIRFLAECTTALRVLDLTNRLETPGAEFARGHVDASLDLSDIAVIDAESFKLMRHAGDPMNHDDVIDAMLHRSKLAMVVAVTCGQPAAIHDREGTHRARRAYRREAHSATVLGIAHGLLEGGDAASSLRVADLMADHAAQRPDEILPKDWDANAS